MKKLASCLVFVALALLLAGCPQQDNIPVEEPPPLYGSGSGSGAGSGSANDIEFEVLNPPAAPWEGQEFPVETGDSSGSADPNAIREGDVVKVHYKGTFEDGEQFDSSEGKEPLQVEVGAGQVIPGFDKALLGMKQGEEKTVTIPAAQAYGEHSDVFIRDVPLKEFADAGIVPEVGMELTGPYVVEVVEVRPDAVVMSNGDEVPKKLFEDAGKEVPKKGDTLVAGMRPTKIVAINKDTVTVDQNHPLAGKMLVFWLKIESVESGEAA